MTENVHKPEDLSSEQMVQLLFDMFHRLIVHHTLWFNEVKHQMGMEKALDSMETVFKKSFPLQLKRFAKLFELELENGLPKQLLQLPQETLLKGIDHMAANWLANDGIWFQTMEFSEGMNDAKRCNDSCWAQFSPVEARFIKQFLKLPKYPGLEGLKQALNFRLYGRINVQSFADETETSFVFQMNDCRVQSARKRKGLEDYPCKSVGLVEYPYFAQGIDSRIETECVGCPPDAHPEEWFCSWKFVLNRSIDKQPE